MRWNLKRDTKTKTLISLFCLCLTPNILSEEHGAGADEHEDKSKICRLESPPSSSSSRAECGQNLNPDESTSTASVDYEYCQLFPDSGQGPFYIYDPEVRSNITEGRPGVPVTLTLIVRDINGDGGSCTPLANVAVDLWHPDGLGYYSGYRSFYKNGRLGK